MKASPVGKLFKEGNIIGHDCSAGNNWAKGFYTEGAEIIDQFMDATRREIELCSSFQGISFI